MSAREWNPGDVAIIDWRHEEARGTSAALCTSVDWIAFDNRVGRVLHGDVIDAHPLVVIDPEDRKQVEALVARFFGMKSASEVDADAMQAALRALANPQPQPPKPDEPTGLGAVVEDADGFTWVRRCGTDGEKDMSHPWLMIASRRVPMPAIQHERSWRAMHGVKILSPGVTP